MTWVEISADFLWPRHLPVMQGMTVFLQTLKIMNQLSSRKHSKPMSILSLALGLTLTAQSADHVFMISVDGLRPQSIEHLLATDELPNIARIQREGVWTHNARTNVDSTSTVPNHISMVTSRPMTGENGHNYSSNKDPQPTATLHLTKGSYVSSVFDVAHDHGLTTSVHRSKSKLTIIDQSYSETTGGSDITGIDDGSSKIDIVKFNETNEQADQLVEILKVDLLNQPIHLAFVHLVDPDRQGHDSNWETVEYYDAVKRVDDYLGEILTLVENNEPYAGRTSIIFTADHGGADKSHTDTTDPENFIIPFYIWGADVPAKGDLYEINKTSRQDPVLTQPAYADPHQPIRNGDMGNLALHLLGLPAIPGSAINVSQDLVSSAITLQTPTPIIRKLKTGSIQLRWASDKPGIVQTSNNGQYWENLPVNNLRSFIDDSPPFGSRFYRVVFE